jgi:hypothetical protein
VQADEHIKVEALFQKVLYSFIHQYFNKFSMVFWDNQWFGRNQICLKLKLETLQFMPGINNLNLKIICIFVLFSSGKNSANKASSQF